MRSRTLALRAGVIAAVAVVLAAGGVWIYSAFFAPIEDPSYFCDASYRAMHPDLSHASPIAATILVNDCAAGKTYQLTQGQTIGVDLLAYDHGVDSTTAWTDVTVSNYQVLNTVRAPARVRVPVVKGFYPVHEVAVYRAAKPGEVTLTATEHFCRGGPGGGCDQGHRWSVTVRVG